MKLREFIRDILAPAQLDVFVNFWRNTFRIGPDVGPSLQPDVYNISLPFSSSVGVLEFARVKFVFFYCLN